MWSGREQIKLTAKEFQLYKKTGKFPDRYRSKEEVKKGKILFNNVKGGWRTIGGKRYHFRSKMEMNYARILQWEKEQALIEDWEYEPKEFWFEKIKRGVRSYKPDFKVVMKGGAHEWRETKGFHHKRGQTALKRMKKYYPGEKVVLVEYATFTTLSKQLSKIIKGWE